ncbi:hypothetical protein HWV62_10353 [Athelia sp. TMB]|nr:hypothetical protein HWV62_10353 [Athelia sp. TMB]
MLPIQFWSALPLLSLVSAVYARAVSINGASTIPDASIPSLVVSNPANATTADSHCYDIRYCRTLEGLVQSCIVTILACVWFAVHRNIPAPAVDPLHQRNRSLFFRTILFIWYKILAQRQAAIVFVVALLAPEWILAWALRQFFVARKLAGELEEARLVALQKREDAMSVDLSAEKRASESTEDGADEETLAEFSETAPHSEQTQLINRKPKALRDVDGSQKSDFDQVVMARRVAKANEAWTIPHAFFIIMGGYYFYNETGPRHPLSPKMVIELVERGLLVPPTREELANQSKGDALSKCVAIMQTLWFVMQCIARRIERLPITSLEVMTLAYTVITVAMYVVWWDKPLNISCAVRVPEEEVKDDEPEEYDSAWDQIINGIAGGQDDYVDLRQCKRVPTFWAGSLGDGYSGAVYGADAISLLVAMVFGAVHCIAWSDTFRSHLEQQMWRGSVIAIITVPAALVIALFVAGLIDWALSDSEELFTIIAGALYVPIAFIYVSARVILILISFTSLKTIPPAAYQTAGSLKDLFQQGYGVHGCFSHMCKSAHRPVYPRLELAPIMAQTQDSFTFTVGKLDAGMAILLGERAHLIEFPSILLPPGATTGSIVNIAVHQNSAEEKRRDDEFWTLQKGILEEFGVESPKNPELELRNVTQTSVTLEWPTVFLATAKLRSLDIYRNGARLAAIPSPLTNNSTKLSGLSLDTEYAFQLVLRTTAGTFPSNLIKVRTHTMSDTSGICVCFGNVQDEQVLEDAKQVIRVMGAKWSDKIQIDTTHFVCTTPAAVGGGPQATGGAGVEYQRALQLSIPVVQPAWIFACNNEKKMMPIAQFYLGATSPQVAAYTRPQSMSQANLSQSQSPSQAASPSSKASNRASLPAPARKTSTSPPAASAAPTASQPAFESTPEEPAEDGGEAEDKLSKPVITSKEARRRSRPGTMDRAFKFPPDSPSSSPPIATAPPPVPSLPATEDKEEGMERATVVAPSSVEVPAPPPVEKERTSESGGSEGDEDVGETEEIALN